MYMATLILPDGQRVPWRRLPSIPPLYTRIAFQGQCGYVLEVLLQAAGAEGDVAMDILLGDEAGESLLSDEAGD